MFVRNCKQRMSFLELRNMQSSQIFPDEPYQNNRQLQQRHTINRIWFRHKSLLKV